MTLPEARTLALEYQNDNEPVFIAQVGQAYDNYKAGDYYVQGFIKGQKVFVGNTIKILGRYHNYYDKILEVYE